MRAALRKDFKMGSGSEVATGIRAGPPLFWTTRESFFPQDNNLGELMSTVCSVHVRGWAGVGACSAEGGRRPGRTRRRAARGRLILV